LENVAMLKPLSAFSAVLLGGLLIATPALAEEDPLLTLEDALHLAKTQNFQLKNADLQINVVEEQKTAVQSKQFPQLSAHVRGLQNFFDNEYTFEEGSLGTMGGCPVPSRTVAIDTTNGFTTHYSLTATQPLVGLY